MSTLEYIVLTLITVVALTFIIRTIVKTAKGENPCMFCKSCGDEEDKSSCSTQKGDEEETKEDPDK